MSVRAGRLDEIVDAEVVFACVLEDGETLAVQSRPSNRQRFSRPDHGIRLRVFYLTDIEHGMRYISYY